MDKLLEEMKIKIDNLREKNISWRNTKMLERSNNLIHIPNTKLSTAIIKNYDSGDPSFSVKIPLGVSYDSDLDHVG